MSYNAQKENIPSQYQFQKEAESPLDVIRHMSHLLEVGQNFCDNIHQKDISNLLLTMETSQSHGAYVILHTQQTKINLPSKIHSSFPIQFGKFVYGMFCVPSDPNDPDQPTLSLPLAKLLAQLYGWLFYTCEQTAIVQGQSHRLEYNICGELTKREYEVLTLMCRGFTQKQIMDTLHITSHTVIKHKQRIYYHLGVHNENDAIIAAYHTGIVSLVKATEKRKMK